MPIERQAIPGLGVLTSTKDTIANSGTDKEVSAQGFGKIKVIGLVPLKTATAILTDDVLNVDEATDSNGVITVDADGEFTVNRTGTTAALPFLVTFIGY